MRPARPNSARGIRQPRFRPVTDSRCAGNQLPVMTVAVPLDQPEQETPMSLGTILLIILILLLVGAIPARSRFGNAPLGIIGTILLIVLILMLLGRI